MLIDDINCIVFFRRNVQDLIFYLIITSNYRSFRIDAYVNIEP